MEVLRAIRVDARVTPRKKRSFSAEIRLLPLNRITLFSVDMADAHVLEAAPRSYWSVNIPHRGSFEALSPSGSQRYCANRGAWLAPPDRTLDVITGSESTVRVAMLPERPAVEFGAGRDADPQHAFGSRTTFPLSSGWGAAVKRHVAYLWREAEAGSPIFTSPVVVTDLEDQLGALILHADSDARSTERAPGATAAELHRAKEFMEAHLGEPLQVVEIARAAGVSVSTLTRAFRKSHGMGPKAFLRLWRLRTARGQLLRSQGSDTTVTDVALDCGFAHLSRFAAAYRETFGELPSETLRSPPRDGP